MGKHALDRSEYPVVTITGEELAAIKRLPAEEIFPALRRLSSERGLIYSRFDSRLPMVDVQVGFRTWRDADGGLCQQNYMRGPEPQYGH